MEKTMEINTPFRDAEFKDESPRNTVARIKSILQRYGIETEEEWLDSGVPYCSSIRINVRGSNFGVNGKGLSKEYTLASGYGELMERMQFGYIGNRRVQKDGTFIIKSNHKEFVSPQELLSQNPDWYEAFSRRLFHYTGRRQSPEEIVSQFVNADGMVDVTRYFNVTKQETAYLPTALQMRVYTANGCAAGNTMEEALVQGIGEIVERNHQLRIIDEEITLPDIPEDVLKKYKVAYDIITYVRSKGYRVILKDASLGTKFPVICACLIQESTGKYHTHFGAYPIFEIALERALTESFQGYTIDNISTFDNFTYRKADTISISSLANELTKGTWERMPSFFVGEPKFAFNENVGFTGKNNKELLRECIAFFTDMGYEVITRDYSCLGFPTYQTIVPGYSEIFIYCLSQKLDDHRYSAYAIKTLRNPSRANIADMLGLLKHLSQIKQFGHNITDVHGFVACTKLELQLEPKEDTRMMAASMAYVYYALGKYAETIKYIDAMFRTGKKDDAYLICLKRYLGLYTNKYDKQQIRGILEFFHRPETVAKLYDNIDSGRNPLEEYTLHCDMKCSESCMLYHKCAQRRTEELTDLIAAKMEELDFASHCEKLSRI